MNNFFGMLARMKYINRWGLMRNTIQENIAEHSLDVAVISHALATIGNIYFNKQNDAEHIAVLAMFQDSYKKVEEVATNQLINELPEEMRKVYRTILKEEQNEEWKYVKAADRLSAYIKCIEESKMGNTDFVNAQNSIKKSIDEMKMPEIAFFIEKFLPSYSITLDEIN
ncbi:HD domain-containing protein [uncultured Eubacterium sp.]|uniref:HD domain-containing protein n=1 Tax=uncultured Eubacterium sp. TaxID=165185 RepID=UPI003265ACD4